MIVGRSKDPVVINGMILTLAMVIIHAENTKGRRVREGTILIRMRGVLIDPENTGVLGVAMVQILMTVIMGVDIREVRGEENVVTLIQKMGTVGMARKESDHIIGIVMILTLTVQLITAPNPKEPKCHQVTNQDYKLHLTLPWPKKRFANGNVMN